MKKGVLLKPFDTKKCIEEIKKKDGFRQSKGAILIAGVECKWTTSMEKIAIIRLGLPYGVVEDIACKLGWAYIDVLQVLGIPRSTYFKKKKDNARLGIRQSEFALAITELLDFGLEAFNQEKEKFQRWFIHPNLSLGGNAPKSLLYTISGIQEINSCLNRIEYGIFC